MKAHQKRLWVMLIVIALGIPALAQQQIRRDGNWWRGVPPDHQLDYMVGFVDGLALGHVFSYWNLKDLDGKLDVAGGFRASKAYDESYRLLEKTTNGQLVDGLSKVYGDYRNRQILVSDAVWIVVLGINGMSDKDMEVLLISSRKNAGIR
jgi:hypothetical protein